MDSSSSCCSQVSERSINSFTLIQTNYPHCVDCARHSGLRGVYASTLGHLPVEGPLLCAWLRLSGYTLVRGVQPIIRRFHSVPLMMTWVDAQRHCRETFADIATIHQDLDQDAAARQAAQSGQVWIGLRRSISWQWSQDASMDTKYTRWSIGEPKSGNCATTSGLGVWSARDCGAQHYFLCYDGECSNRTWRGSFGLRVVLFSSRSICDCQKKESDKCFLSSAAAQLHVLVKQLMNWTDAQTFCRTQYSHLSSIRTVADSLDTASLVNTKAGMTLSPPSVWIGLSRQTWVWSDQSNASYRRWAFQQPEESADCAVMDADWWYSRPCGEAHAFLCHSGESDTSAKGRSAAVRVVKVRLSAGSAERMIDASVENTVLRQVRGHTMSRLVNDYIQAVQAHR